MHFVLAYKHLLTVKQEFLFEFFTILIYYLQDFVALFFEALPVLDDFLYFIALGDCMLAVEVVDRVFSLLFECQKRFLKLLLHFGEIGVNVLVSFLSLGVFGDLIEYLIRGFLNWILLLLPQFRVKLYLESRHLIDHTHKIDDKLLELSYSLKVAACNTVYPLVTDFGHRLEVRIVFLDGFAKA